MRSSGSAAFRVVVPAVLAFGVVVAAQGPGAAVEYTQTIAQEEAVRARLETPEPSARAAVLRGARSVVAAYEGLVMRYPRSGYSDNALWQGARMAADVFWTFGEDADRATALRLIESLAASYPTSPLLKTAADLAARLRAAPAPETASPASRPASAPTRARAPAPATSPPAARTRAAGLSTLRAIRREVLPEALRVTLELEREAEYSDGSLDGPPRVFLDLRNTTVVAPLKNATIAFDDDIVRQVRIGHHENARTRVVLDLAGQGRHSIYALYDPYRVVIDFERPRAADPAASPAAASDRPAAPAAPASPVPALAASPPPPVLARTTTPSARGLARVAAAPATVAPVVVPAPAAVADAAAPEVTPPPAAPATPAANGRGGFSLSRQLGLGIARIVVDPGHGGRDPGAEVNGLSEADLVLDIAVRFEKLMLDQHGVEVVLTRRKDVYVPLEERTAIANRAEADLFVSIHANASANTRAVGIETYFLNFATNPEAEAIAARENAGSARTMRELNEIVRTIATNNKVDESRDFARSMQTSMFGGLRRANRNTRNLGVKQAPFTVLVGARMPGLLTEVGFLTHPQEGALLKTERYRQLIAEAMATGVLNYQRSLKTSKTVATK